MLNLVTVRMMVTRIFLLLCLFQVTLTQVSVNSNMKSFSYAIKNGWITSNVEKTLYEHDTGEPGVITEQWFTGSTMNQDSRIRIYIDGELEANLDFDLFLAHGLGFTEKQDIENIPWGTRRIAHTANGGIYNTIRIPFSRSFRVTATTQSTGFFWYIVRGVENYPVVLGDLILPSNTRLRLYKNEDFLLRPLEFLPLADIKSSAGALFMVTMVAESSNLVFLEGCMRAYIDGSNKTTWLSSGTEDFFLSAFYFNEGLYHLPNAGLTFLDRHGRVSAYKFFENDPLLFTKSFELWWRCSDMTIDKDIHGCPNTWPDPTPPRDREFFTKYAAFKDKLYSKGAALHKDNLDSKLHFSGKEELSSEEIITLKQKIAKEGPVGNIPMAPATVTTYTWVYEW
ncbi:uncharacterized protein [Montipora capricornis]|uniref:uncharacterized protein n=1 Tax=Montipora capricornis TaxID=246305 RepID=UPI0035F1A3ED